MRQTIPFRLAACCVVLFWAAGGAARAGDESPQVVDSKASKALQALPPKPLSQRIPVTIYEFRSGVPEINVGAATDMFTTALIKSAQFRVVERERLNQGVVYEKQLNGAGQTTGDTAQKQLTGARYIFEGTVSEANASQDSNQGGINVGGFNIGHSHAKDVIAIDVRIVDADTGDVLDAVAVSQAIDSSNGGVSGTAALASSIASLSGHSASALTPDVSYETAHKDSVDAALRACIDASVLELIKHIEGGGDNNTGK
jgi:curli biogenesis system outer membrane secretion channel CsgG